MSGMALGPGMSGVQEPGGCCRNPGVVTGSCHMTYAVIILSKAQKYLDTLEERAIMNIWSSIAELKNNPYRSRPLADIIKLRGFKSPPMYRLRVGRHRLEYFIDENDKTVTITNAFIRSGDSDYR
jgi:mRNA-degrading endonuclease RelE of RelBE toxin-antitoxin system